MNVFKNLWKQLISNNCIDMNKKKASFSHDAAYSDSYDLAKRTISDEILTDKTYKTARIENIIDTKSTSRYGL